MFLFKETLIFITKTMFYRSDVIEIESWIQGDGKIGVRRDWVIKDCANGEVIGRATRCLLIYLS